MAGHPDRQDNGDPDRGHGDPDRAGHVSRWVRRRTPRTTEEKEQPEMQTQEWQVWRRHW